jgi:hypothetical protein
MRRLTNATFESPVEKDRALNSNFGRWQEKHQSLLEQHREIEMPLNYKHYIDTMRKISKNT